jgi:hypothetical protein
VRAIRVLDDGRIIVAGDADHDDEFFNNIPDDLLASFQPNGAPGMDFGINGMTHINVVATTDMVVRANGDIVVSTPSNGCPILARRMFCSQSCSSISSRPHHLYELHASTGKRHADTRGMDTGIFPFVRDGRTMGLFPVNANLRYTGKRFKHHGCLRSDFVRARMGAIVPD